MTASLSIAVPRAAAPKGLEVRPKQVKAWIEGLPLANALEASKQLGDHLRAVNAAKIEIDDRLQILQDYRAIAQTLFEELEAIFAKTVGPLSPRAREALALTRDLAAALADGYKIVIAEKTGKLIAFGAKKQLPLLLLRAMEYANVALRASYKSYTPAPEGL